MPWAVAGAVAGAATSSLLAPSTSGGSGSGGANYYVPTGLAGADQNWQSLNNSNFNTYQQTGLNQYGLNSLQTGINDNSQYSPAYQNAGNAAGQTYGNVANTAQNLAGTIGGQIGNAQSSQSYLQGVGQKYYGQAAPQQSYLQGIGQQSYGTSQQNQNQLQNAAQQVYGISTSQNNPLYQQSIQNLTDQTNAQEALRGLGNSAEGGAETNQALTNFNNAWNQQEVQNAQAGLQGLTSAYGTGNTIGTSGVNNATNAYGAANTIGSNALSGLNSMYNTAGNYGNQIGSLAGTQVGLGTSAAQNQLLAGSTPYSTAQTIAATPGQLGNAYGSYLNANVYGPAESMQSQAIPYMNYGQGAQAIPYQSASQGAGAAGSLVSSALNNSGVQNAVSGYFGSGSSPGFYGDSISGGSNYGGSGYGFSSGISPTASSSTYSGDGSLFSY